MRLAVALCLAAMAAAPAEARWHYCYNGIAPDGVQTYPDMPPRTFGFEIALLPATFKRLCGQRADPEAAHLRRIVADYLECGPSSDLAQRIEARLNAPAADILTAHFDIAAVPVLPEWLAVCDAAQHASVANLAFADTWYFDSPDAAAEGENMKRLLARLAALSTALAGQTMTQTGDSDG